MPAVKVYPYDINSKSARLLADALGTIRVRANGTYVCRPNHKVINWGSSTIPNWGTPDAMQRMINPIPAVKNATNKLETFARLQSSGLGNHIPDWTSDRQVAAEWLATSKWTGMKKAVVCRTQLRAAEGRGIVLAETPEEIVPAPLYTRYTPKSAEYRVHASRDTVIDVQQKRRKNGWQEDPTIKNKYIRNHGGGWVFCHENVTLPIGAEEIARLSIAALGLDFGAVDIGYHPNVGIIVYEVNTAPGIEGRTVEAYKEYFQHVLN